MRKKNFTNERAEHSKMDEKKEELERIIREYNWITRTLHNRSISIKANDSGKSEMIFFLRTYGKEGKSIFASSLNTETYNTHHRHKTIMPFAYFLANFSVQLMRFIVSILLAVFADWMNHWSLLCLCMD